MTNIFITGGAGYVGSTLISYLFSLKENFKITVLDNLSSGGDSLMPFMGNKNFIPRTTETESHVANKTDGSAQTIYQQVPAGAMVTKIFYRFNGQDHGYGAPARVPHLAVLDSEGNWHETYDEQKKGPHNTMENLDFLTDIFLLG